MTFAVAVDGAILPTTPGGGSGPGSGSGSGGGSGGGGLAGTGADVLPVAAVGASLLLLGTGLLLSQRRRSRVTA